MPDNSLVDACDQLDLVVTDEMTALNISHHSIDRDFDIFQTCSQSMDDINHLDDDPTNHTQQSSQPPPSNLHPEAVVQETNPITSDATITTPGPHRYVTPKDFELLKVIGMGAFGKVLQVRNKQSQQLLAMKVISKRLLRKKGEGIMENIIAERNILTKVSHNFIVKFHCSFQTREKLFIIMDFLAGGELFLRIGKEGIFLEKTASFYLAEIILALDHLHNLGILHRDLKPENILLGKDGHICLTDFGLAKEFGRTNGSEDEDVFAMTICGTQEYMAPEMIAKRGYGRAADFWSLGCIAYEMLSGFPPFDSRKGSKELFRRIMSEKVKMPQGCSAAACKLLKGLLNRNVQARLGTARSTMFEVGGVAGLKQQEFFRNICDWDKLANKQIDPPITVAVDGDQDLQHFYDEFTKMSLPKSVYEMCHDDKFQPRHVQSGMFRGFSFVASDFVLPDRNTSEEQAYWESVEEDGESVSECASSKIMTNTDDDGIIDERKSIEVTTPAVKKRPPRKRKKKHANGTPVGTAANTPDISAANSPEPSEVGGDGEKESAEAATITDNLAGKGSDSGNLNIPATVVPAAKPQVLVSSGDRVGEVSTLVIPSPQPDVWLKTSTKQTPAKANPLPTTAQVSPARQQAKGGGTSWNSVATSSQRREGPPSSQNGWNKIVGSAQKSRPQTQKVIDKTPQKPWNGWGNTPPLRHQQPATAQDLKSSMTVVAPPKNTLSPSTDWRKHHMSPRDNAGRPVLRIPPPSTGQSSWPSLNLPQSSTATTSTRQQNPQGVWGVKKS